MATSYGARRYLREAVNLPSRMADLEAAVAENHRLTARLDELTDLLAELLVPAEQRDEERVRELLARVQTGGPTV